MVRPLQLLFSFLRLFSPGKLIQLNTGDRELLYFEAPRGKQQYISRDDALEIKWDTWTCVLGQSVSGIWPAYTDVTDINTSCVSRDGEVIATGDDFGYVKLFKFPSPVNTDSLSLSFSLPPLSLSSSSCCLPMQGKHAKCKQYVGHSSHVTNVRFTYDDSLLVSTGGGDTSIMVWSNQGRPGHSNMEEGEDTDSDSEEEGEQYIAMQLVEENVLCCSTVFRFFCFVLKLFTV